MNFWIRLAAVCSHCVLWWDNENACFMKDHKILLMRKPLRLYLSDWLTSCSSILLDKPPDAYLHKNPPIFYGTRNLITVFTRVIQRPLLSGSLVTRAWRALVLRMEETASRYGGSVRTYFAKQSRTFDNGWPSILAARRGVNNFSLYKKSSLLQNVTQIIGENLLNIWRETSS
jgi:hypothetical protein